MKKLFRHVPDHTRFIKGYFEKKSTGPQNEKFKNRKISNTLIGKKQDQENVSIKKN